MSNGLLAVFVGASGSGKSTLADAVFGPGWVVSSDVMRELVSGDANDQETTKEAFELLYRIVATRCRRHLVTAVDSTALRPEHRAVLLDLAAQYQLPCVAVAVRTPPRVCLERQDGRARQVPWHIIKAQCRLFTESLGQLPSEGFAAVTVIRGGQSLDSQAGELGEFLARHGTAAPAAVVCAPDRCLNGVACYAPVCYGTSDYARADQGS